MAFTIALAMPASAYEQPIDFHWKEYNLDVIIVPPGAGRAVAETRPMVVQLAELNPLDNSYMRAVISSVEMWAAAIQTSAALRNVTIDVYVAGRDPVPVSAAADPEIIVTTDITKGPVLGFAASANAAGERTCIVDNSRFWTGTFSENDMFNVNAQEFGHCLGLGHVCEAGNTCPTVLEHDPMNGAYPHPIGLGATTTDRHCASDLNIKGLEQVFTGSAKVVSLSQRKSVVCR